MSITANPGATISDWTPSKLIKFIKQMFETDPPAFLPRAKIQDLEVTSLLQIDDQVKFIRDPNYHQIGSTGEPSFKNSWVNLAAGNNAAYWKDPFGHVHLMGMIKSGTVGSAAFTLPVGFRPQNQYNFATTSNSLFGLVQVNSTGDVTPVSPSSNTNVSLDGLHFKTV